MTEQRVTENLIGVTGVTGAVGGRVARRLAAQGVAQRLIVRDPARCPDLPGTEIATASYEDPAALGAALKGVHSLFFVSAGEHEKRVGLHLRALDVVFDAGVQRIVYTSFVSAAPDATFTFARDHWHTEQHIRTSGTRFTFLRNSLYLDFVVDWAAAGEIRGPAGNGRFAPVARDDIADVAVAALLDDAQPDATFDVTGSESLTWGEIVDRINAAGRGPVRYIDETVEEAYASRAHYRAPQWMVDGWVSTYLAIAGGELDVVSDTVLRLAGHPPMALEDMLAQKG